MVSRLASSSDDTKQFPRDEDFYRRRERVCVRERNARANDM